MKKKNIEITFKDKGFEIIGICRPPLECGEKSYLYSFEFENCYPISTTGFKAIQEEFDHRPGKAKMQKFIQNLYNSQDKVTINPRDMFTKSEIAETHSTPLQKATREIEERIILTVLMTCSDCKKIFTCTEYGKKENRWYHAYDEEEPPEGIQAGDGIFEVCFNCFKKHKRKDKTIGELRFNEMDIDCMDIEDKIFELEDIDAIKTQEEFRKQQADPNNPEYDPVFDPESDYYFENLTTQEWFEYNNRKKDIKERDRRKEVDDWREEIKEKDSLKKNTWEYDQATGEEQQTIFNEVKPETNTGEFIGDLFTYED